MNMLDLIKTSVTKGLKGRLKTGQLNRIAPDLTAGLDNNGDPLGYVVTSYACEGFPDQYSARTRAAAGIPEDVCKICILAGTISVRPTRNDETTFDGIWYRLSEVSFDPAEALYTSEARKIKGPTIGC